MQQDADECMGALLSAFKSGNFTKEIDGKQVNIIDHLFDIEMESKLTNPAVEDEPEEVKSETVKKLNCHIDNGGKPVDSLHEGIALSLKGEVEKFSEATQSN